MIAALVEEKPLFWPFVFNMLTAFAVRAKGGHNVATRSVPFRLETWGIINTFLLRKPGGEAQDRPRSSASVLPVPIAVRTFQE